MSDGFVTKYPKGEIVRIPVVFNWLFVIKPYVGILCKGSLDVVVIALGPLKTSLLTSTKGNTLSAYLSRRDSCTHSQLMHMFNLCMLCFFLLCINAYLHLFLLVIMIASCVYNIIAFRLLGCILIYLCSPCMIACGVQSCRLCAGPPVPVVQRRSPVQNAQWRAAGRALVHTSARPPALIAQLCSVGLAPV